MTAFVRRVPAEFDTTYWRVAPGYMERELGAVSPVEAGRHESPKGFADTAGAVTGQRKDQSYCFAPYDGLRGLGMTDYRAVGDDIEDGDDDGADAKDVDVSIGRVRLGDTPSTPSTPPPPPSALVRAVPYVIAAAGLLWLLNKTAKETAPPRPAR